MIFPKWHLGCSVHWAPMCWKHVWEETSEDDSLMSLLTANLAVWEWEGAARVFISLRKINTSDLRWEGEWFSRVNFPPRWERETAVRGGCSRTLPPIFTGDLSKLRLVTEVTLLPNTCIRQILASNLMNLGWICMQAAKARSKKCTGTRGGGTKRVKP